MYNLVRIYFESIASVSTLGFCDEERLKSECGDLLSFVESDSIHLVKTHYGLPEEFDAFRGDRRFLEIYNVRNIREIAMSMFRVWGHSEDRIITQLNYHTAIATDKVDQMGVIIVRYEKIVSSENLDLLNEFSNYLGVKYDVKAAKKAAVKVEKLASKGSKEKNYIRILKKKWITLMFFLNKKFRIGEHLKTIMPTSAVQKIKERALLVNRKTMMHPGHVAGGENSQAENVIGDRIATKYVNWQAEFDYE